ncbi:hypothetical protein ATO7_05035 [Oceanococcus atlanticus]|uniref:TPR repeat-containing protein n=1 Tax=Oceanococcus atlanticus TaxID=1317117 RepID=A0A1Y1SHT7_9GAMM|nr:hypothetical protein [Oceanococcus atlanticus]ORE89216.1 hypothetical protein ATO7_05035 [Oceanococcus atlanticus]
MLIATVWAYLPGLAGDFLFDDYANLSALGAYGPIDSGPAFWRYITSGIADPTGRPIALLSFLLDARDWPADAHAFKRNNLALHVFNSVLLLTALWRILATPQFRAAQLTHAFPIALMATAFWALHPLMVSTTLYVVQRQAMLPATFFLLALHGWISGRLCLHAGRALSGFLWMSLSVGCATTLATLSKANGVLLPSLIGVVEITLLGQRGNAAAQTRGLNSARIALLLAPSIAVLAYLLGQIPSAVESSNLSRPWTLTQRLLTEPRALFDYLGLLVLPRPFTSGLFNDNYLLSSSLSTPWSTLPALGGIIGLCWFGFASRYHRPLLASALMFFFVGHALESTVIPLELHYEHRNYLPALLLFLPLAAQLRPAGKRAHITTAVGLILTMTLAFMTHARSTLWGNPHEQALVWAALNPDSPRAQTFAAAHEMRTGQAHAAYARLSKVLQDHPNEIQLSLNSIRAACLSRQFTSHDLQSAVDSITNATHGGHFLFTWLTSALESSDLADCEGLPWDWASRLLDAAHENGKLSGLNIRQQELLNLQGQLALSRGDGDRSLSLFNQALELHATPATALAQAAALGNAGFANHGLLHLQHFEELPRIQSSKHLSMTNLHQWILQNQGYWKNELTNLRMALKTDAQNY